MWKFWQMNLFKFSAMISIALKRNFIMTLKACTKIPKITYLIFTDALKLNENILFPFQLPTIFSWILCPTLIQSPEKTLER